MQKENWTPIYIWDRFNTQNKKNVGCHIVDLVQVLPYFSDFKLLTFNYLMFLKDKVYKSIRETQTNALLSTTNDPHIKQIL